MLFRRSTSVSRSISAATAVPHRRRRKPNLAERGPSITTENSAACGNFSTLASSHDPSNRSSGREQPR